MSNGFDPGSADPNRLVGNLPHTEQELAEYREKLRRFQELQAYAAAKYLERHGGNTAASMGQYDSGTQLLRAPAPSQGSPGDSVDVEADMTRRLERKYLPDILAKQAREREQLRPATSLTPKQVAELEAATANRPRYIDQKDMEDLKREDRLKAIARHRRDML